MRAWHCLLCGLDFGLRTELEWHVREDHPPRLVDTGPGARPPGSRSERDWAQLHELQGAVDHPSVSLLMGTVPAPTMNPLDVARLRLLAGGALCRLVQEAEGKTRHDLAQQLAHTVAAAEKASTHAGLALFVSAHHVARVVLPFRPRERVVVDAMFATRDLLDGLQRYPHYRVLVLAPAGFRILEGRARRLKELVIWHAPSALPDWLLPRPGPNDPHAELHVSLHERPEVVLSAADLALTKRARAEGALPLVLAGQHRLFERFRQHSSHAGDVVGEVHTLGSTLARTIGSAAEPVVSAWCAQNTARCLIVLGDADREGDVAWGLDEVWQALRAGQIEHLWVERDYAVGARLRGGGAELRLTRRHHAPGVTDDVIEEIIDLVTATGGPVELVDHLSSDHEGHIAAKLRSPAGHHVA